MSWRLVLAAVLLFAPLTASANGRPPATSTINFRQGHETDIAVGLTFGLLISSDGGQHWQWVCEDAVGYQGTYDPRYAFGASGALFATTFDGLKVARDTCTFDAAAGSAFASTDTYGTGSVFYYASAQAADANHSIPADFNIYVSTDDGAHFKPTTGQPQGPVSWWQSLVVAPSDQKVLYVSGYAFLPGPNGVGTTKQLLIFRSDNSGTSWTPLPLPGNVTVAPNSVIDIIGVASDDPTHVYMRVELDDNTLSDSVYVSTNAGVSWTQIAHENTSIAAFVVRAAKNTGGKHDLVLGIQTDDASGMHAEVSHDDGMSWTKLPSAPHMGCLVENTAGELWACTSNYGFNGIPSDNAGIMKITDPEAGAWTSVLRYQDLTTAVTCTAGSVQATTCATSWCGVCSQLGCTPDASYHCPAVVSEAPAPPTKAAGCCEGGPGGAGALAIVVSAGMLMLRPRRRRAT